MIDLITCQDEGANPHGEKHMRRFATSFIPAMLAQERGKSPGLGRARAAGCQSSGQLQLQPIRTSQ